MPAASATLVGVGAVVTLGLLLPTTGLALAGALIVAGGPTAEGAWLKPSNPYEGK